MELKFSKSIDNNVREYPLWLLILGSVIMVLLAIAHVIRCKQSSKKFHYCFVLCLICSTAQYICATQNINTAFLTIITDFIAILANTVLFYIWANSMKKYIGPWSLFFIFIISLIEAILAILIIITLKELDYSLYSEDNRGSRESDNSKLASWQATLILSITCSIILTLLALLFQGCLGPEEYISKRQKRLQLARLFLLSLLLSVSKFGTLFGIPLLYIIPFLLFHAIPILKRDSVSSYYHVPDDSNV
jgi:phosphoglycerol transferase MdoB-like AlkP superfamily enzyme